MQGPPAARLLPAPRSGLPAWCGRYLARPGSGDFFASRAWYNTTLAHALPEGTEPLLAVCGRDDAALLPLLRRGRRFRSLTTPYTLAWRPLSAPGADPAALREAGRGFGRLLRFHPPARFEALDPGAPGLDTFLSGLREAGLLLQRYRHFGNWYEAVPPGLDWGGYLAARPPALRTTIRRKLARCDREMRFELLTDPGPALERGIAAYEEVRARSWKPHEPFPRFDGALMRAAAGLGALRLGVLRARAGAGGPVAAQYWILDGGRAWLLKLAHAEESRAASPGTALTAMMIRRLLEEGGLRELDFGRGDDSYKRLWVGGRRRRTGVVLVDPLHPAGLLEIARWAAGRGRRHLLRRWLGRDAAEEPAGG